MHGQQENERYQVRLACQGMAISAWLCGFGFGRIATQRSCDASSQVRILSAVIALLRVVGFEPCLGCRALDLDRIID